MKKIEPFRTLVDAKKSLDNGGRLFNLFSTLDDGTITEAEINKAAGVTSGSQESALFLLLASSRLNDADQQGLTDMLTGSVKRFREKYAPEYLIPADVSQLPEGINVIVHGKLEPVPADTEETAFTKKLHIAGKVPTYEYESIFEAYRVYRLTDSNTGNTIFAVHDKAHESLHEGPFTLGCVSRSYFLKKSDEDATHRLLEIRYYID